MASQNSTYLWLFICALANLMQSLLHVVVAGWCIRDSISHHDVPAALLKSSQASKWSLVARGPRLPSHAHSSRGGALARSMEKHSSSAAEVCFAPVSFMWDGAEQSGARWISTSCSSQQCHADHSSQQQSQQCLIDHCSGGQHSRRKASHPSRTRSENEFPPLVHPSSCL